MTTTTLAQGDLGSHEAALRAMRAYNDQRAPGDPIAIAYRPSDQQQGPVRWTWGLVPPYDNHLTTT